MSDSDRRLVAIMGPTGSGKTELAVELVSQFPLEIISVDSVQVYRGLDRGSAKPDADTLAQAPHRLIDNRDPWQAYSAADFVADAAPACREIWGQGRVPLLVGGTSLYFQALEHGLSPLPSADPEIREQLAEEARTRGWEGMHAELKNIDPVAAKRIHPNDPQRIQRALEVFRISGQPMSELQDSAVPPLDCRWLKLIVSPTDRAVLHERIEARFLAMLQQGLIEEVAGLRKDSRIHAELPAMRAVGYRQVWQHLEGEYDRKELARRGVFATRQLAKRQLTWLRRQSPALWLDPTRPDWLQCGIAPLAQFLHDSL
jgi:tRNA dimethylallyltransferase